MKHPKNMKKPRLMRIEGQWLAVSSGFDSVGRTPLAAQRNLYRKIREIRANCMHIWHKDGVCEYCGGDASKRGKQRNYLSADFRAPK